EEFKVSAGVQASFRINDELFRLRKHTARARRGIIDFDDLAFLVNKIVVSEEHVNHQLDNFARSEVVPGLLIGLLIEAPDKIFEHVAHCDARDRIRVQVYSSYLLHDFKESVGFLQLLNLIGEVELFNDLARTCREPSHKFKEVRCKLVGITDEILESEVAGV